MVTIAYTPAYQVYLSRRCAFACDYCNFPNVPSPLPPSPKQFRAFLRTAQRIGAWQVTLGAGEGIDHLPEIESTMRYYGFHSWSDYIGELCQLTLQARGRQPLMPVVDVGPIPTRELRKLASVVPLMRLLLDTVDPALAQTVHANAPQKSPLLRSLALNDIGRAGIPAITGIRVGIGENPDTWAQAVETVNEIHGRHGNIMAFHLLPFVPEPFSRMGKKPPVSNDTFSHAVKTVRRHLSDNIVLVAEVHQRLALAPEAVVNGAFDLGPIQIADNERFDIDMLNAVDGVGELLNKIEVKLKCAPALREQYVKDHRLPSLINENLQRFADLDAPECLAENNEQSESVQSNSDTPAEGSSVPVG